MLIFKVTLLRYENVITLVWCNYVSQINAGTSDLIFDEKGLMFQPLQLK